MSGSHTSIVDESGLIKTCARKKPMTVTFTANPLSHCRLTTDTSGALLGAGDDVGDIVVKGPPEGVGELLDHLVPGQVLEDVGV